MKETYENDIWESSFKKPTKYVSYQYKENNTKSLMML